MTIKWLYEEEVSAIKMFGRQGASAPLAQCIHASRLIGASKTLVVHGGGNTSVKTTTRDVLGREVNTIYIKASGHDLAGINIDGFTALDLDKLKELEGLNRLSDDHMLAVFNQAKLDFRSPSPSVETLMHVFLPAPYIFHTHANSVLAVTNQPNGKTQAAKVFGPNVIVLPYAMSGFELAKKAAIAARKYPDVSALVVIKHGVFTFGISAKEAYGNMIRVVNFAKASVKRSRKRVFVGRSQPFLPYSRQKLAPLLRGALISSTGGTSGVILEFRTNQLIRKFLDGKDLIRYANTGPVTPDHVIWTKPKPLILPSEFDAITVRRAVEKFTVAYKRYFTKNNQRFGNTKTMREASPRVVLVPGQGLYGAGDTAENASMIADLAENWIEVITAAESIGKFSSISTRDMFDIEYWSPESAKLEVAISPPLKGRVALITGGGSGIGQATAQIFRDAGAEVVVLDVNANATRLVAEKLDGLGLVVDVTDAIAVGQAFKRVISSFGGLDIVVSNAGGAWQGEIGTVSESVLRKSFELNFFAHQTIAQNAVRVMRAQHSAGGSGGCILFNTSKQAVNPGRNFGPYGLPKAATLFLVRQYALDHGKHGIRTGGVNADRVRSGLLSDEMIAMRSKARKLSEDEYLRGNLLGREVTANDVAKAFFDLALSPSTTGAILTVDGGNIEAALR